MAASDAGPVVKRNTAHRFHFVLYDVNGDLLITAAGLDSEISKDGAAFSDCTNEATYVGNGLFYLDVTAAELNVDGFAISIKDSDGNLLLTLIGAPEEPGDIRVDVTQISGDGTAADRLEAGLESVVPVSVRAGSSSSVIETDLAETTDDHYKGRSLFFRTGTLAGQAVPITGYGGASKQLTVTNNTADVPASGDLAVIL